MTGLEDLQRMDKRALLAEFERRLKTRKLQRYAPYFWQKEFHDAGAGNPHRMLMAANRVGKTLCAAMEAAMHATGKYPPWWRGARFAKPTLGWASGVTTETARDIIQRELLGEEGRHGTGAIPGDDIEKVTYRQAGVSAVADVIRVRHVSGGTSPIVLKSSEQGWRKFQGAAPDWIWLDEEPDDHRIFTECTTRVLTSKGVILVTFTPLLGETELVRHFLYPKTGGIYLKGATWDDAPHLDKAARDMLAASFPDHEREARIRGVPMMGSGAVFPVGDEDIWEDPFEIPRHFPRIVGIDFGIDHPFAAAWLAWDREGDVVHLYDCYRRSGEVPAIQAEAIKRRGDWIPVAWPEDGLQRDKGSGRPLRNIYAEHDLRMLPDPAQYGDERGKAVEPGLLDMLERMKTGRWKAFKTCADWMEEKRGYHRKEGRVVKLRDDLISASRYALMGMYRYATTEPQPVRRQQTRPIFSTRL